MTWTERAIERAACAIVLLVLLDAHGIAMLGGLVIGVLVGAISPPDTAPAPAAQRVALSRDRGHGGRSR